MSTPNRGGRGANVPASDRPTKADRKEQARLEREAIQRDMARKRRTRSLLVGGLLALAVGGAGRDRDDLPRPRSRQPPRASSRG